MQPIHLTNMFRRIVLGLAVGGAALAGGTLADAAIGQHFRQTITESSTAQSANYPNPGSTDTSAGTVRGTLGTGRIVQVIQITGHPTPTTYTIQGTDTVSYRHGTLRSAFSGTGGQVEGSVIVTGQGHYTGGTGPYRGARGNYSLAATIPQPDPTGRALSSANISGTIFY